MSAISEHNWSLVLVDLLKSDRRTGVAMYQALKSAEAKRAALSAAARVQLSSDDYLIFKAAISATGPVRKVRNQFAHQILGYSVDIEDSLLLIDQEELLRVDVNAAEAYLETNKTSKIVIPDGIDVSKIQVWKRRDLEEAERNATDALGIVFEVLNGLHNFGPGLGVKTRELLLNRSAITQAVQANRRRSVPVIQAKKSRS
ncbi:MAG: hypothetical protein WCC64_18920 [Aliidongia sp.]